MASTIIPLQNPPERPQTAPAIVAFHRTELGPILSVYGRMVAAGEWRDYAMSHGKDIAIFAIFRRAAEHPLYRITKQPKLAQKQGAYAILSAQGVVLKRGRDLRMTLRYFDRQLLKAVEAK